jgi:uncharacterized iron-regulated membrane protein
MRAVLPIVAILGLVFVAVWHWDDRTRRARLRRRHLQLQKKPHRPATAEWGVGCALTNRSIAPGRSCDQNASIGRPDIHGRNL